MVHDTSTCISIHLVTNIGMSTKLKCFNFCTWSWLVIRHPSDHNELNLMPALDYFIVLNKNLKSTTILPDGKCIHTRYSWFNRHHKQTVFLPNSHWEYLINSLSIDVSLEWYLTVQCNNMHILLYWFFWEKCLQN